MSEKSKKARILNTIYILFALTGIAFSIYFGIDNARLSTQAEKNKLINESPSLNYCFFSNYPSLLLQDNSNNKSKIQKLNSQFVIQCLDNVIEDFSIQLYYSFDTTYIKYPFRSEAKSKHLHSIHKNVFKTNTSVTFDLFGELEKEGFDLSEIIFSKSNYYKQISNYANDNFETDNLRFISKEFDDYDTPRFDKIVYQQKIFFKADIKYLFKGRTYRHFIVGQLGYGIRNDNVVFVFDKFSDTGNTEIIFEQQKPRYVFVHREIFSSSDIDSTGSITFNDTSTVNEDELITLWFIDNTGLRNYATTYYPLRPFYF